MFVLEKMVTEKPEVTSSFQVKGKVDDVESFHNTRPIIDSSRTQKQTIPKLEQNQQVRNFTPVEPGANLPVDLAVNTSEGVIIELSGGPPLTVHYFRLISA